MNKYTGNSKFITNNSKQHNLLATFCRCQRNTQLSTAGKFVICCLLRVRRKNELGSYLFVISCFGELMTNTSLRYSH